ncbi:ethanolamine ammonia-lyase subunit EutB [Tautonia sociabilis]|uniref:Ethanolamine ammonia-lyase subunit EutB n=1 Tax=Tautonia sociabilis TaxID=2080755 RepID=A0A432MDA4_9BACT|nr:ethanolamine ammonia-lyase subunit EutB [Tautonia sociabilis]RUL81990.1 ethanolamine ammonia-lyase subunit EutB [Tautonia sociabilis]
MRRRDFLGAVAGGTSVIVLSPIDRIAASAPEATRPRSAGVVVDPPRAGESLADRAGADDALFARLLGAANAFKEGDALIGVAAASEDDRRHARTLLANTPIRQIDARPLIRDSLTDLLRRDLDPEASSRLAGMTVGQLKAFLLDRQEDDIKALMPGLSSAVIGCVVKLMSDEELTAVGAKVFNPLPGSKVGAKGYLGARIQPNSPTDNVDDIRWQVFSGWSFAVGDVVLGTNPVSSTPESVLAVEETLKDLLVTFGLEQVLPHCVLAHIDVQAEVERRSPGSTALWFQSIAGSDAANRTFDISTESMLALADARTGPFGLYFETGQGADFTNGHAQGVDMVLHEARKYGFARALSRRVAQARGGAPWVHLNDVAGFIGPEVFRSREQLVRCCLEDIVMGKLHGLCIGLDVCSTLHMDVSLDDLDWCLDRVVPAAPAYLMALPTKIDPMLGYLTTGFQDHVRLRDRFGTKVDDRMWSFFQRLGVIDADGRPTEHFGDPVWVYLQYRRRKGDDRAAEEITSEALAQIDAVRSHGVFLPRGHGKRPWDLEPGLEEAIDRIYADAKQSIWAELSPAFIARVPHRLPLSTRSADREDYILHPESGERLSPQAEDALRLLRARHAGRYDAQIVISDGLNALAIGDEDQLFPFLDRLRAQLSRLGYSPSPEHLVVTSGRVRAGYRIGEALFGGLPGRRALLHVIGERPGTGHRTFSVYLTAPTGELWGRPGAVDHNITKVVSGIATTALPPVRGADDTIALLELLSSR